MKTKKANLRTCFARWRFNRKSPSETKFCF